MTKQQHCFYCGEHIGLADRWSDPLDTCGKAECNREAQYANQDARDSAHEQLDRDMGW